jgi:hypothetical protein
MLVVARRTGCRLGNRLEQATHLIAFNELTGHEFAIPVLAEYAGDLRGMENDWLCRFPSRRSGFSSSFLPHRLGYFLSWAAAVGKVNSSALGIAQYGCDNEREVDMMDGEFLQYLTNNRVLVLRQGWKYRCWKGLESALPAMRKFFSPGANLEGRVNAILTKARKATDQLIGVHIRHTDFRTHLDGRYFFPIKEYARVMREIARQLAPQKTGFLVCSDTVCEGEAFPGLSVSFGSGKVLEDLFALAGCDRVVGPAISSFSGWASLHGNKPFLGLQRSGQEVFVGDFGVPPLLRETSRGAVGRNDKECSQSASPQ